ncbi:MAG: hypothetical protein IID45_06670 [Planctomycetes bacterium]|nr:hypothetical protein [Planctomycetota bacterium]
MSRRPFEGLTKTQREFEAYRKMVQSLEIAMNAVLTSARQDGENRARQVLNRIAASVRQTQMKR